MLIEDALLRAQEAAAPEVGRGRLAEYIPGLASVDPHLDLDLRLESRARSVGGRNAPRHRGTVTLERATAGCTTSVPA